MSRLLLLLLLVVACVLALAPSARGSTIDYCDTTITFKNGSKVDANTWKSLNFSGSFTGPTSASFFFSLCRKMWCSGAYMVERSCATDGLQFDYLSFPQRIEDGSGSYIETALESDAAYQSWKIHIDLHCAPNATGPMTMSPTYTVGVDPDVSSVKVMYFNAFHAAFCAKLPTSSASSGLFGDSILLPIILGVGGGALIVAIVICFAVRAHRAHRHAWGSPNHSTTMLVTTTTAFVVVPNQQQPMGGYGTTATAPVALYQQPAFTPNNYSNAPTPTQQAQDARPPLSPQQQQQQTVPLPVAKATVTPPPLPGTVAAPAATATATPPLPPLKLKRKTHVDRN